MVTFNFTYSPGVTIQQALGFEIAGRIWSHYYDDPVTVNIHIGIGGLTQSNVIGGALPGVLANQSYSNVRARYAADATSNDDQLALVSLPNTTTRQARYEVVYNGTRHMMPTQVSNLDLTRANAKALGLIAGNHSALDGVVMMSNLSNLTQATQWSYNYTRTTANAANSLDFLSVALHELGHIMGFVSGVDLPGMPNNVFTGSQQVSATTPVQQLVPSTFINDVNRRASFATPMDLFRIQNEVAELPTGNDIVLSSAWSPLFAINNGHNIIGHAASGKQGEYQDGFQTSHWERVSWGNSGIMLPNLARQERLSIAWRDVQAMDILGWNRRSGHWNAINLSTLQGQAISALAQRLGQTTTWIQSNLTTSPSNLVRDRDSDVSTMITNSLIYEWGTTGSGSTSTSGRRWMEVFNQMASAQRVYFSKVIDNGQTGQPSKDVTLPAENTPPFAATTDETDAILGFSQNVPLVGQVDGNPPAFEAIPPSAPDNFAPVDAAKIQYTGWQPISTFEDGAIAVDEPFNLGETNGSRSQAPGGLTPDWSSLLGLDNNPLMQTTLTTNLMAKVV